VCGVTGASTYYTSSLANYEDVKQQLACQGYTIQVTAKPNVAEYMYRAEEDPERERFYGLYADQATQTNWRDP
jgi:hypothetical protein